MDKIRSHHERKPYRGIIRNQGFLGGAGFRPPTATWDGVCWSLAHVYFGSEGDSR